MKSPEYPFLRRTGRVLNSGQARSVLITGNVYDLYHLEDKDDYVPLIDFLVAKWRLQNVILLVYEINGPIRFVNEGDEEKVRNAWLKWRTGYDSDELAIKRMLGGKRQAAQHDATSKAFDTYLETSIGSPTVALELLRQLCLCSRAKKGGKQILHENLIILIESADLIIPEGQITSLSDVDRHRVSICHDWFLDPGFANGDDSAVLITESRSMLNHRVARLPQVLEVPVPSPDLECRRHFITWFNRNRPEGKKIKLWASQKDLAKFTAGLSIHAIMQLLKGAVHENKVLSQDDVIAKVEDYIQSQLGDDIVEFKKPSHTLKDLVGFNQLKSFLKEELIPRFSSTGDDALPGAAVGGPIGAGKTYVFEALAAELDMVVLVLKSIRSQWFGQTDVIFERLRRVLEALTKVLIFVDEADTQFGGVGPETHSTERRLTGKIQAMMSDPRLRGRVIWLLMTARIHLLSPDIRRPGRVGDLIIPILDPEGEDRREFIQWIVDAVLDKKLSDEEYERLDAITQGYAAANFASLRSELKAKSIRREEPFDIDAIVDTINEHIPPPIGDTRRYQTLQALVNCTRKSLLPDQNADEASRRKWMDEIRFLEQKGIR